MRNYLSTSVVLTVANDTELQIYLGTMVCIVSGLLVAYLQPYQDPLCGRLQLICLAQLIFTYMSGLLFFDDSSGKPPWGTQSELSIERWAKLLIAGNVVVFLFFGAPLPLRPRAVLLQSTTFY